MVSGGLWVVPSFLLRPLQSSSSGYSSMVVSRILEGQKSLDVATIKVPKRVQMVWLEEKIHRYRYQNWEETS